jgi:branched-chain amino acid aminotransferase
VIVFLGGRLVPEEQAAISIEDRGFLHGDGVFETGLLHEGGFFRLRPHLERLAASAAALRLPAPPLDELDAIVRDVVRANGLRDASLRITLTRGTDRPTLLVTARPRDASAAARARGGWSVVTATTRRPSTAAVPAQLKALGRTYALLARHEAVVAGADDALLLTDHGHVCEGPTWNVFWRTGNALYTPSLDGGVLSGVTRAVVIRLAQADGMTVHEGLFGRMQLEHADEAFATMTSLGVVTIHTLDGRRIDGPGRVGPGLQERYWRIVADEAAADPA